MKIYIDSEYRCHTTNPDGIFREVKTKEFDGKCTAYIEGKRFVPSGESWTRNDGEIFAGEMVTSWKDDSELNRAQREYEKQLLAEYEKALAEIEAALGV